MISVLVVTACVFLAFLPTALVLFSVSALVRRRKLTLQQDFLTLASPGQVNGIPSGVGGAQEAGSSVGGNGGAGTAPLAIQKYLDSRGGIARLIAQVEEHMTSGIRPALATIFILNSMGFVMVGRTALQSECQALDASIAYTFIGTYLFNLGSLVRRIALADISAHLFWGAVYRLALAVGLAVILGDFIAPEQRWGYFSVGFLANSVLEVVLGKTQKLLGFSRSGRRDAISLQMVRGIDFWKEGRLEEEGISSIQNLATADVLDLSVKTHYNLLTLIDWIDQAIVIHRFQKRVLDLEAIGVSISAIDLGWSSPSVGYSRGVAEAIAKKLGTDPALIVAQMDSLYEDEHVRHLWSIWQTRPGFEGLDKKRKSGELRTGQGFVEPAALSPQGPEA